VGVEQMQAAPDGSWMEEWTLVDPGCSWMGAQTLLDPGYNLEVVVCGCNLLGVQMGVEHGCN